MQLHRLADLSDPVDPELAAARDLLRGTRPLEPSIARMQRVHAALMAQGLPPATAGTSLLVKVALLAAAVLVGLGFLARERRQLHSESPQRPAPVPVSSPPVVKVLTTQPRVIEPPLLAPPALPVHGDPPSRRRPSPVGQRSVPQAAPPVPPAPPAPQSAVPAVAPPARVELPAPAPATAVEIPDEVDPAEAALVLSATQRLRQQADPTRALTLLSEYQSRFPRGALQEEALALNLECLVALADRRAGPVARTYLERYPGGRFRGFAAAAAARYPASSPE